MLLVGEMFLGVFTDPWFVFFQSVISHILASWYKGYKKQPPDLTCLPLFSGEVFYMAFTDTQISGSIVVPLIITPTCLGLPPV